MSGGEGFGPVGPVAAEGPPFSVAGPSTVSLDGARSGSGSFTVSNVTGRPVRARLLVLPGAGADAAWFQVVGESERLLPVAGTATVDVSVRVAEQAPAGAFSFAVGAALEEAPDRVVSGPTVAFQVAGAGEAEVPVVDRDRRRRSPAAARRGRHPDLEPHPCGAVTLHRVPRTPGRRSSGPMNSCSRPPAKMWTWISTARPTSDSQTLICRRSAPNRQPTIVFGLMRGVAIVPEPTFEQCRDVFLAESVEVPHADAGTLVCVFTSDRDTRACSSSGRRRTMRPVRCS